VIDLAPKELRYLYFSTWGYIAILKEVLPPLERWAESFPELPEPEPDERRFLVNQLQMALQLDPRGGMEEIGAILRTVQVLLGEAERED
jgi:hypothetical protein